MLSSTFDHSQYGTTTFFESPTEERSNVLFTGMFREKIETRYGRFRKERNVAFFFKNPVSDPGQDDNITGIINLSDEWRNTQIEVHVRKIRLCCAANVGGTVANRLEYLRVCLKEEEGQDMDVALDSLQAVRTFLERSRVLRIPDVSLTANGDVYLRWKDGSDRMLAIHFLDDRKVRFALLVPNPRHAHSVKRYSGLETVDTVLDSVDSLGAVRKWICQ